LSNLANRQTDRQTDKHRQKHLPPSFVGGKQLDISETKKQKDLCTTAQCTTAQPINDRIRIVKTAQQK